MILVTGGTGLVGSHLLYALAGKHQKVRALIRPKNRIVSQELIFKYFADSNRIQHIEWVEGDVLDMCSLHEAMQGVKQVYHSAAKVSFSPRDKDEMMRTNIEGTANVVNSCLENKVSKLCHVSSIAALGSSMSGAVTDEKAIWKTAVGNSEYAISKYRGECEVWRGVEEGLNAVIINPSIITGASYSLNAVNSLFPIIHKYLKYYTVGSNGYVDVSDVVNSMILLMESDISGERFVISSENITIKELISKIATIYGQPPPGKYLSKNTLSILSKMDLIRSGISGKRAMLTKDSIEAATAEMQYSSQKFISMFNYSFKSIDQSLSETFARLEEMKS